MAWLVNYIFLIFLLSVAFATNGISLNALFRRHYTWPSLDSFGASWEEALICLCCSMTVHLSVQHNGARAEAQDG